MKMYWQFKIKALAEKAIADNKRINGAVELNGSIASLTLLRQSSNIWNSTTNCRVKKRISTGTTLTSLGLIPIKMPRPCSFYNRLPLSLTAMFWTLNPFWLTRSFICIKMNLDCLLLNTGIPSLFRSQITKWFRLITPEVFRRFRLSLSKNIVNLSPYSSFPVRYYRHLWQFALR